MVSALHGMRILALPLTALRAPSSLPLTYYHFQTPPPSTTDHARPQSILRKITAKAADVWAGFGRAPHGNWKRKVFVYGEKAVDRVDFEELSLKGVDPSLGPRIGQLRQDADKVDSLVRIPLLYPPSCDFGHGAASSPLIHIQTLLAKRKPQHRKGFYLWWFIAPLTAPIALVPLVPNLPFFYAAWRAWSHYRAWKASEYLEGLINSNHVVPQPSPELDQIYASRRYHPPKTPPPGDPAAEQKDTAAACTGSHPPPPRSSSPPDVLLLDRDAVPRILEIFQLSESAGAEIIRAIKQARVRVQKDEVG